MASPRGAKSRRKRGRQPSGTKSSPPEKKDKKSPRPRTKNKWSKQNELLSEEQETQETVSDSNSGAAAEPLPTEDRDAEEDSEDSSSDEDSEDEDETGSIGDTDNDKTFHGFQPENELSPEDLNDLGKIASLLVTLSTDIRAVKKNQGTVLSELKDIKKGHKKISKELKKQSKDIESLKESQSVNKKSIDRVEASVGNHERWLTSNDERLNELEATVGDLVLDVNVNGGKIKEYPYHRTVVALNVPYEDGENLMWKARNIINNFLELPDINIIRAKRKGLTDDKLGIVKMELPSEEAVDDVIKCKHKLSSMEDETISNIYIRQSQPDDTRTSQHNDRLLIKAIDPHGEKFKYLRSGRIVPITDRGGHRGRGGPNRGRGGPGRGRGGPGRGRGGPRGRGSGHARRGQRNQSPADYSKWTRSDKKPGQNVPPNGPNPQHVPTSSQNGMSGTPGGSQQNKGTQGKPHGPSGDTNSQSKGTGTPLGTNMSSGPPPMSNDPNVSNHPSNNSHKAPGTT